MEGLDDIARVVSDVAPDNLIARRGKPVMIVSDHGTEFTSSNPGLDGGANDLLALHRSGVSRRRTPLWKLQWPHA